MKRTLLATAALLLFAGSAVDAVAHGIWIAQRHGELAIVYGHGASDEAYDPAKITAVAAHDGEQAVPVTPVNRETHALVPMPERAPVLIATMDNGYWSQGADGKWVNKPKSEVPGAKQASRSLKHTVAILRHTHDAALPKGLRLEIVPAKDPTELQAGDPLEVLVLLNGEPLANAPVTTEYTTDSEAEPVRTGADGKATIVVRNNGLNVVAVSAIEAPDEPEKADRISHFSTLSFNLGHHEH